MLMLFVLINYNVYQPKQNMHKLLLTTKVSYIRTLF